MKKLFVAPLLAVTTALVFPSISYASYVDPATVGEDPARLLLDSPYDDMEGVVVSPEYVDPNAKHAPTRIVYMNKKKTVSAPIYGKWKRSGVGYVYGGPHGGSYEVGFSTTKETSVSSEVGFSRGVVNATAGFDISKSVTKSEAHTFNLLANSKYMKLIKPIYRKYTITYDVYNANGIKIASPVVVVKRLVDMETTIKKV